MIITEQKELSDIFKQIKTGSVFLIGCNQCATLCHTGGESEILTIKKQCEANQLKVTGYIILDPACHYRNDKRLLKSVQKEIDEADVLLIFSCGNGAQVIRELYPQKQVISGTNTLFLGAEITHGVFERQCLLCGSCVADDFEGFCPIAQCPKQMLNGPCGGSMHGQCELGQNLPCVWEKIIQRKMEKKSENICLDIIPAKDWSTFRSYEWRTHDKH